MQPVAENLSVSQGLSLYFKRAGMKRCTVERFMGDSSVNSGRLILLGLLLRPPVKKRRFSFVPQ